MRESLPDTKSSWARLSRSSRTYPRSGMPATEWNVREKCERLISVIRARSRRLGVSPACSSSKAKTRLIVATVAMLGTGVPRRRATRVTRRMSLPTVKRSVRMLSRP